MKKFKKLMSALLACAMLLAIAIPVVSVAAEDKVEIRIETVEGATAGQKNVEVKLFATADPHWSAIDFNISYDPSKLTFKNIVYNQAIKDQQDDGENVFPMLNKDDAVNGNVIIVFMTTTKVGGYEGYYNVDNSGEAYDYVGTMKFDVAEGVEDGTYDITCTLTKCSGIVNDVQQDIPYEITNGAIKVGEGGEPEPCEHEWNDGEVTTEPTCTEAGEKTFTCSKCGETKTEPVDALGHDWGEWEVTKEATETEDGEQKHVCNRCGAEETEVIPATGGGEEPPVTGDKVKIVVETVEGATAGQKNVEVKLFVTAEPHWSAIDFNISYDPSKLTFKNIVYNQAIKDQQDDGENVFPMLNKDDAVNGNVIIVFMTTTKVGGYEGYYNVDNSGEAYDYVGTMKFDVAEGVEDGTYDIACTLTKCSGIVDDVQQDIPYEITNGAIIVGETACEHEWNDGEVTTEPTCTEAGKIVYTCTKCGETREEDVDALGHDWGEWEVTKEATCTEKGEQKHVCSRCGEEETEEIDVDPDAHQWNEDGRQNATCSAEGWIHYSCVNNPDHEKTEPIDIDPEAHVWDEGVVTEPTCTEGGYTTYTCTLCGATKVENETEALGHDWGEWEVTKEATATEDGEQKHVCNRCGAEETEVIPATGEPEPCEHEWNDGEVTKEPTCTEAGEKTFTCSKCGETKTEAIDALGHDWGDWTVVKEATETEEGLKERTCNRCGEKESEAIPKLTPSEPEKTEPTVTGIEDGATYDVGKGQKPAPTWEPADAEGTLNGEAFTPGTEITKPGEYELVVKNGDKTTTIKFTVTDSTASGEEEPTNTSDLPIAGIAIVALIASAAVVVIARKKRFAR